MTEFLIHIMHTPCGGEGLGPCLYVFMAATFIPPMNILYTVLVIIESVMTSSDIRVYNVRYNSHSIRMRNFYFGKF